MAANTIVTIVTTKCSRSRATAVRNRSMRDKPICTFWRTTTTWRVSRVATARNPSAKRTRTSIRTKRTRASASRA